MGEGGRLTHKYTDDDHEVRLIIENVEEHDERLKYVEEYGTNRETFQRLTTPPELHVCARPSKD